MSRKPAFNPLEASQAGSNHRAGALPQMDESINASSRQTPGRKADFPGERTARLNAFLPVDLAWKVKETAFRQGKSISQLVAEWARTL